MPVIYWEAGSSRLACRASAFEVGEAGGQGGRYFPLPIAVRGATGIGRPLEASRSCCEA